MGTVVIKTSFTQILITIFNATAATFNTTEVIRNAIETGIKSYKKRTTKLADKILFPIG